LGEPYFHLYNGVLIHYPEFGPTVVQEKFLVVYLEGLSSLHIAHKATEEIGVQIGLADVLKGLILFGASFFEFGV
jgi:predicted Zn-dependent protease